MTFGEWTAAQETPRADDAVRRSKTATRIRGWLRVAGDGDLGRFDLIGEPRCARRPLVEAALAKVANRERACTLVPEYQVELARTPGARGLRAAGGVHRAVAADGAAREGSAKGRPGAHAWSQDDIRMR